MKHAPFTHLVPVLDIGENAIPTTPKPTPPPITTTPPPTPSQPSKKPSPLATTIKPLELIFSTPPTFPHPFLDELEDLPPRTSNPPPLPSFESIEQIARQPPPISDIMDVEPPPYFLPDQTFQPIDQSLYINCPPPQPTRHENMCDRSGYFAPSAPSQPSKKPSPLATTIEPLRIIFLTPHTSPYPFLDELEDLPPRSSNPPPLPSLESIEQIARQPSPIPDIMDVEPPLYFPPHQTF
ncbi:hypothetical protein Tco_1044245 [Tanacetum coccineum]|uniref:Extensin-like n=1 Tax=Tanacetum coccineum TaxID=301880 RepID=A0ABQ5GQK1_9ASTR